MAHKHTKTQKHARCKVTFKNYYYTVSVSL